MTMDPPEKECWERGNGYANTCQSICHAENQIDFSTATIKCVSLTVDLHIRQLRPAETKPVNYNKSLRESILLSIQRVHLVVSPHPLPPRGKQKIKPNDMKRV